jgi:hypothetical protein
VYGWLIELIVHTYLFRNSLCSLSISREQTTMADNDDMAGIHQALAETAQQINEDVTTRYRAAAIAHRQGQQIEQRALNNSGPVEAKRPVNLAPKGIPMSLILRSDPEEGVLVFDGLLSESIRAKSSCLAHVPVAITVP